MAITKTLGVIKFSYEYDEIFEKVSLITNEIAVTILDEEKMPQVDEYGISEDEKYTVVQKMNSGADEIFRKLLKITNGISDSVLLSDTVCECAIKDKGAYNENILQSIDRLIEEAIVNYIIKDWFTDKMVTNHAQNYTGKYVRNIQEIVKKSVQLRKPTLS